MKISLERGAPDATSDSTPQSRSPSTKQPRSKMSHPTVRHHTQVLTLTLSDNKASRDTAESHRRAPMPNDRSYLELNAPNARTEHRSRGAAPHAISALLGGHASR